MAKKIGTGLLSMMLVLMTFIGMMPMSVMAAETEDVAKSVAFSLPYQTPHCRA